MIHEFTLKGTRPLIMHNGRLANPMDPFAKMLKAAATKRGKGDEDYVNISRIEFAGGLYWDSKLGPYIPTDSLQAMLVEGARKHKLGKQFEALVQVVPPNDDVEEADGYPLEYVGPRDVEGLFNHEGQRFVYIKMVRVGQAKVPRTRPRFLTWSITFKVEIDDAAGGPTVEQVRQALEDAGHVVGFCDWRPRYGRFEVIGAPTGTKPS